MKFCNKLLHFLDALKVKLTLKYKGGIYLEVYQTNDGYVLGVSGGKIYNLRSEPAAIISTKRPIPTKMWIVPKMKDESIIQGQEWFVDVEFREFLCDDKKIQVLQFNYERNEPGYCSGTAEFIVSEEYAKEKIETLRKTVQISEYSWDTAVSTWK